MKPVIQSVALPHGPRLQYVEQGERSGIPVVLLHGVTDSWRSFEPVLPHLPPSVRAFALTQRGHGDAERPAAGYGPRDFAGDVAQFMDVLEISSAVIVGHSMGSSIGQRFALDHPERTLGLVLVGAFTSWTDSPSVMEFWETAVSTLEDPVDPHLVREFQESTLSQPVPPGFIEMVVQESLKVPARVWRAVFKAFLEHDASRELNRIEAPTLIVWGDQDPLSPRAAQHELLRAIAGSDLVVYEGAGHALHWEEAARFAADLVAFARSSSGAALRSREASAAPVPHVTSPAAV
jgi:pimeloyl-ACP methyl ester carboxylesterase